MGWSVNWLDSSHGLRGFRDNECETQLDGFLAQGIHLTFLLFVFVNSGPYIHVLHAMLEQVIDRSSDFMGGGDLSKLGSFLFSLAAIIGTKGRVAA
jgi:hypothetical protein